jgi:hypothetical protein
MAFTFERLVSLLAAALAGWMAVRLGAGWAGVFAAALAGLVISGFLTTRLRRYPPPVSLEGGTLRSGVRYKKLGLDGVAQIYTSEHNPFAGLARQGAKPVPAYWVCALHQDGSRCQLLGPLAEVEHALYVEERLEAALGLANRSVVGDLKTRHADAGSAEAEALRCDDCGAPQEIDSLARRRGFLLCSYCRTATLLDHGGTLGEPLAADRPEAFRVLDGEGLEIYGPDDSEPLLAIDAAGELWAPELRCAASEVDAVLVQAEAAPPIGNVLGALGKLGELTAHTAGSKAELAALASNLLDLRLKIVAKQGDETLTLIGAIDNPTEAFRLAERIRARTGAPADP